MSSPPALYGLGIIIIGIAIAINMFIISEISRVFLDTEENTRRTHLVLEKVFLGNDPEDKNTNPFIGKIEVGALKEYSKKNMDIISD